MNAHPYLVLKHFEFRTEFVEEITLLLEQHGGWIFLFFSQGKTRTQYDKKSSKIMREHKKCCTQCLYIDIKINIVHTNVKMNTICDFVSKFLLVLLHLMFRFEIPYLFRRGAVLKTDAIFGPEERRSGSRMRNHVVCLQLSR